MHIISLYGVFLYKQMMKLTGKNNCVGSVSNGLSHVESACYSGRGNAYIYYKLGQQGGTVVSTVTSNVFILFIFGGTLSIILINIFG